MSLTKLIISGLFFSVLAVAQSPARVTVTVDVSNANLPEKIGTLSYDEAVPLPGQTGLRNMQLTIGDQTFYPGIHISAYLDEISGTAICRKFGFERGVLGATSNDIEVSTFSINVHGEIEVIRVEMVLPADRRSTKDVLCFN